MTSAAALWAPVRWAAVEPPRPTLPRFWIDVSNWQGNLPDEWFDTWGMQGFQGLIVQAVTGEDGKCYTPQQCRAALDHGWALAGYVWCAPGDFPDGGSTSARLSLFDPFRDQMHFVALDVEQEGTQPEDVDTDLALCDAYIGDAPIYTGQWFFDQAGWSDHSWWASRRLWTSDYDNVADVDAGFRPYGGWSQAWMKQYTSTPLDLNVMRV